MDTRELLLELRRIVGTPYVLVEKEDVIVYEQDGSIFQVMPEIVVVPANIDEVAEVVKAAKRANVPIVLCRPKAASFCR
jgi:glycolate oxidase